MTTPPDEGLFARTADALTREHYRRAKERIEASPEEHCAAFARVALSVRSEHEAQLAGRWGDATRRAELAETRVERLEEALRDAYADRDQQFARKVAALRERDEAKRELSEAQRTIAAHERHINDMFEANRRVLQKVRERRNEAQDERDELKAKLAAIAMVKVWTNEDGKRFMFADDLADILLPATA